MHICIIYTPNFIGTYVYYWKLYRQNQTKMASVAFQKLKTQETAQQTGKSVHQFLRYKTTSKDSVELLKLGMSFFIPGFGKICT